MLQGKDWLDAQAQFMEETLDLVSTWQRDSEFRAKTKSLVLLLKKKLEKLDRAKGPAEVFTEREWQQIKDASETIGQEVQKARRRRRDSSDKPLVTRAKHEQG